MGYRMRSNSGPMAWVIPGTFEEDKVFISKSLLKSFSPQKLDIDEWVRSEVGTNPILELEDFRPSREWRFSDIEARDGKLPNLDEQEGESAEDNS